MLHFILIKQLKEEARYDVQMYTSLSPMMRMTFHLDQATKRGSKIRCTNVHFSEPNDEDEHQNQLITTLDGYSVPLLIKDGLAYATSLRSPTDQDMDTYPHVFFTSLDEWDPSVLHHDPPHIDGLDPSQVPDQPFGDPMFDAYGDFNEPIIANLNILLDAPPGDCWSYTEISSAFTANLHQSSPQEPDRNALCPFFAWTSPSSIKDTFNVTTRHGTAPNTQDYIEKHFKSRNPVFNIPRCSEAVATDTIFSDTPAVDDGSTMA